MSTRDMALEALRDILAGWKYIRNFHGDLYGVGWERAQGKAEAAIAALEAPEPPLERVNCVDPMCACHGGPCVECEDGERERDRLTGKAWREDSSLEKWFPLTAEEIEGLKFSLDFYRRRVELLQQWQSRMRDPERTIVCDIIANGQTLPDVSGSRYGAHPPAPQDGKDAARDKLALAVINAARTAMDESFEADNVEKDVAIPSHWAAALSLCLDQYDAAIAQGELQ